MASVTIAHPGAIGDQITDFEQQYAMALKVFAGETLTAFQRTSVTNGRTNERTIQHGKSAQFPVFGRATAKYLKAGDNLDDQRVAIKNGERTIVIDGLLTSDQLIFDLDSFILHYDFRSPYATEMGNALAIAHDASVLAEIAKEATNTTPNVEGLGVGGIITKKLDAGLGAGINAATGKAIYDILLEGKTKMANNYVPTQERYAYMLPEYHSALASALDFLNRNYGANGSILEGNIIRLAGFDILECPHLTQGGADPSNAYQGDGHVFPSAYKDKKPILMCHKSSVGVVRLKGLSMESGRRINYQSDQLVATMAEGIGGLRPEATFMGIVDNGDGYVASMVSEYNANVAAASAQLQKAKEATISMSIADVAPTEDATATTDTTATASTASTSKTTSSKSTSSKTTSSKTTTSSKS